MTTNKKHSDNLIFDRLSNNNAGTGTNTLRRRLVKGGRKELIRRVSANNKTSNFDKLRVGVWDGGLFHVFEEHSLPKADTYYFTPDLIIVRESMQLQVEFQGCTSGDNLEVFIQGEWEKRDTK